MMPRTLLLALTLAVLLAAGAAPANAQTAPPGPCTDASAREQFRAGAGHEHTTIEQHEASCRMRQQAFLPLDDVLDDEVLGEMDIKADIAAVAVSYPQAGALFFDVSDPARPRFLSRYESSECEGAAIDVDCGAFVDLSADGRFAFLSLQQISAVPGRIPPDPGTLDPAFPGVEVIDLSDPSAPRLSSANPMVSQGGVHTARSHVIPDGPSSDDEPRAPGEYVFSTVNGFGVEVSRVVRGPVTVLQQVDRIAIDEVHDMFLQDDPLTGRTFMYIAAGFASGFYVYDVTDPAQAELIGEWDISPQCTEDWYAHTIDVATRGGRRYVTMPAELFDNGEQADDQQALGCGAVSGNGDKAGPMWIVDATDLSRLGQEGESEDVLREKSEAALVTTWTNAAGRAGGDLAFSPHNQQIVGDQIYLSGYHSGVTVLDASAAFAGRAERPREVGFIVPTGKPTRPIYDADAGPLVPFISRFLQYRPLIWDMVPYRGSVLAADETGGFYSFTMPTGSPASPSGAGGSAPGIGASAGDDPPAANACVVSRGFASVSAAGSRGSLRFGFRRVVDAPVEVALFRQSVGRRVIGNRLIKRFRGRETGFRSAVAALGDGYYFARFTMVLPNGERDVRRVALRRVKGRFRARPAFYRRASCGLVSSYKLERTVFGGRTNRAIDVSFRLTARARVTVEVLRGTRVVRRFATRSRAANITHRLRLTSEALRRGDYRIRLSADSGTAKETRTLTARRL